MVKKLDFSNSKNDPFRLPAGEYVDTAPNSRLQLRVRATGSRSWSVQFWSRTEKRLVRWTLPKKRNQLVPYPDALYSAAGAEGRYAEAQLQGERAKADRAGKVAAKRARAAARAASLEARNLAARPTLAAECAAWLKRERGRMRPNTVRGYEGALARVEADEIGSLAYADVTRLQVTAFRNRVKSRAAETKRARALKHTGLHIANDTVGFVAVVLNALVNDGALVASPIAGMERAKGEKPREHWLKPAALARAMTAAEEEAFPVGLAVLLSLHTLARVSEIIGAKWSEFDRSWTVDRKGDGRGRVWTLPAARNKSNREFLIPLSDGAMALLKLIRGAAGSSPWLFPSNRYDGHPIATAQHGLARIAVAAGLEARWTFHDLRRTGRTMLSEIGVRDEVAEACLNHAKAALVGTYNMYAFLPEKREALQGLSRRLEEVKSAAAKVVALPAAVAASGPRRARRAVAGGRA